MNIRELYQTVILDHNSKPRNFREMGSSTHRIEGYNPLCGDHLHIYLHVVDSEDGAVIENISFEGSGCAISKASASLMTEALKGRPATEARKVFERFHDLVTADTETYVDTESVGKLAVFAGVREFPMRGKCATLAWHAMSSALSKGEEAGEPGDQKPVKTE